MVSEVSITHVQRPEQKGSRIDGSGLPPAPRGGRVSSSQAATELIIPSFAPTVNFLYNPTAILNMENVV